MNKQSPIYLDYNATTPISKEVADTMTPYLYEIFGNPSSSHPFGVQAKLAIEKARKQIAEAINCQPTEVLFTSGGTESNNYAIRGYVQANQNRGRHIITSAIEHPAVLEVCRYLENQGFRLTILPVDSAWSGKPGRLEKMRSPLTRSWSVLCMPITRSGLSNRFVSWLIWLTVSALLFIRMPPKRWENSRWM